MRTIAHYTHPDLIVPRLQNTEPAAIVGELCSLLERAGRLSDPLSFFNAVISHEMISSTVASPAWALPHGRIGGVNEISLAVGRCFKPIRWFGPACAKVEMVFLFVVPEQDAAGYLALLSGLGRLGQDTPLLEKLSAAGDGRAMHEVLRQIRLRQQRPAAGGQ